MAKTQNSSVEYGTQVKAGEVLLEQGAVVRTGREILGKRVFAVDKTDVSGGGSMGMRVNKLQVLAVEARDGKLQSAGWGVSIGPDENITLIGKTELKQR